MLYSGMPMRSPHPSKVRNWPLLDLHLSFQVTGHSFFLCTPLLFVLIPAASGLPECPFFGQTEKKNKGDPPPFPPIIFCSVEKPVIKNSAGHVLKGKQIYSDYSTYRSLAAGHTNPCRFLIGFLAHGVNLKCQQRQGRIHITLCTMHPHLCPAHPRGISPAAYARTEGPLSATVFHPLLHLPAETIKCHVTTEASLPSRKGCVITRTR